MGHKVNVGVYELLWVGVGHIMVSYCLHPRYGIRIIPSHKEEGILLNTEKGRTMMRLGLNSIFGIEKQSLLTHTEY